MKPEEVLLNGACDVFLHGHTHAPEIRSEDGVVIINPGHLKGVVDRGSPPSFALISLTKNKMDVSIYDLVAEKKLAHHVFSRKCG